MNNYERMTMFTTGERIMKKTLWAGLAVGVMMLGMTGVASATLLKNGNIITDTATNLEWYTLTGTSGYSFNQMQVNFTDTTSQFFGYAYASLSDIKTLWSDAGYTGDYWDASSNANDITAITTLFNLFEQTGANAYPRADGMFDDTDGGYVSWAFLIPQYDNNMSLGRVLNDNRSPDEVDWQSAGNNMGSFIYKQNDTAPVPEPATLLLFGAGIAGLAAVGRRKRS